ncbi:MAG: hypothetical protein EXR62_09750 [Chloroflexi bacterium]|nr:hypothetical protein [Chloroflexota bacterium]
MQAINLEQAIRFFDPRKPLTGQELDYWFIERQDTPRHRLGVYLRSQLNPVKVLLIGPRGSGKTSELNKLAETLVGSFHTIGFSVLDITGRTNLDYVDLMLSLLTQVTRRAIEEKLLPRPLAKPLREGLEDLRDWWRQLVAGLEFQTPQQEASIHIQLPLLIAQVEAGIKQSALTRQALNERLDLRMPEVIQRLDWVAEQVERRGQRRLLLVVEGLDKIDLEAAQRIFRDRAATITAPRITTIFTFPNSLRFSDDFDTIRRNFDKSEVFPNFVLRRYDDQPDLHGPPALRRLVLARLAENLVDVVALDAIVQASGGQLTSLVSLAQTAALVALTRHALVERIELADVAEAESDLRKNLVGPLSRQDYDTLRARHADRRLTNEPQERRLLYNSTLLEYSNGQSWCDVHPALWPLL